MKKYESSIVRAPHPMMSACFKMEGTAMLPTTEALSQELGKISPAVFMYFTEVRLEEMTSLSIIKSEKK